jgi:hypothetical protein
VRVSVCGPAVYVRMCNTAQLCGHTHALKPAPQRVADIHIHTYVYTKHTKAHKNIVHIHTYMKYIHSLRATPDTQRERKRKRKIDTHSHMHIHTCIHTYTQRQRESPVGTHPEHFVDIEANIAVRKGRIERLEVLVVHMLKHQRRHT